MKYIVKVVLKGNGSFDVQKKLDSLGFMICIYDTTLNEIQVMNRDYSGPEKILFFNQDISYTCLYNGDSFPMDIKEFFEYLETKNCVISYMVEKRVS